MKVNKFSLFHTTLIAIEAEEQTSEKAADSLLPERQLEVSWAHETLYSLQDVLWNENFTTFRTTVSTGEK